MDQDPFGLSLRKVDGPYRLEQFESGSYYLQKAGANQDGGGCIDGVVVEIGWTNGFIFAKRHANFPSDGDGWMVIEVRTGKTTGPLSENNFRKRFPTVRTLAPAEAWKKL